MIKKNFLGAVLVGIFLVGTSYAQDAPDQSNPPQDQGSDGEHAHHTPPQAAIDACSGKSAGDTCDYTNAKGEDKAGACANTSDGQTLFCKRSKPANNG